LSVQTFEFFQIIPKNLSFTVLTCTVPLPPYDHPCTWDSGLCAQLLCML